ncbi:hypothetical protein HF086_011377, partial [Spodoptera exigua]
MDRDLRKEIGTTYDYEAPLMTPDNPRFHLHLVAKTSKPSERPIIRSTKWERLSYYRALTATPCKTEIILMKYVELNACDTKTYYNAFLNVTIQCYNLQEFAENFRNVTLGYDNSSYVTSDGKYIQISQMDYYRHLLVCPGRSQLNKLSQVFHQPFKNRLRALSHVSEINHVIPQVKFYFLMKAVWNVLENDKYGSLVPHYMWSWSLMLIPLFIGVVVVLYQYLIKQQMVCIVYSSRSSSIRKRRTGQFITFQTWQLMFRPMPKWGPREFSERQLRKQYSSRY